MRNAARLSRVLRPLGVPLPEILAEEMEVEFPYLVLDRLPGSDLSEVMPGLSGEQLESVASAVVNAQRATASLASREGRYGYAASCDEAPWFKWPEVLTAHLARSRQRMAAAALFDIHELDPLSLVLCEMESELNAVPSIPFLHDTTTKNVIVTTDGRFSGIVDVDDLCFGDPRYVLALTEASLLMQGLPLQYTSAWRRLGGFADDRRFRLYVALFLADFMAERGQIFNGNESEADSARNARLLELYRTALAPVIG
jgi:aminoglycoside phosphotransferase (APT) family kinase protein